MPELIIAGRGHGKTRRCIELAHKHKAYIVCPTRKDALRIMRMAEEMGKGDILFPITSSEFLTGRFGRFITGFVIDDVDRFFEVFTRGIPIHGMSMQESCKTVIQDDRRDTQE